MKHLFFLLLLFVSIQSYAQDQRFIGGFIVGLNASQIDGDQVGGFNKAGLAIGLRGGVNFTEKTMVTIDMLYSLRGSRFAPNPKYTNAAPYSINTPYVEVPVLFHLKDWTQEYEDGSKYQRVSLDAGVAFGYLINPSVENYIYESEIDNFNKIDFGYVVGASFYLNEHIGLSAKYQRSLNLLYNNQKYKKNLESLVGYHFNFSVIYTL